MRKFTTKIEFSAEDMAVNGIYSRMVNAIEDEFGFDAADTFRFVLLPDAEITDEEIQSEAEFDNWVGTLIHKFDQKLQ